MDCEGGEAMDDVGMSSSAWARTPSTGAKRHGRYKLLRKGRVCIPSCEGEAIDGIGTSSSARARTPSAKATEAEAWLTDAANFGRVFVTGDSVGATIANHLAVHAGVASDADEALKPASQTARTR
jgi:hypothetical protein